MSLITDLQNIILDYLDLETFVALLTCDKPLPLHKYELTLIKKIKNKQDDNLKKWFHNNLYIGYKNVYDILNIMIKLKIIKGYERDVNYIRINNTIYHYIKMSFLSLPIELDLKNKKGALIFCTNSLEIFLGENYKKRYELPLSTLSPLWKLLFSTQQKLTQF